MWIDRHNLFTAYFVFVEFLFVVGDLHHWMKKWLVFYLSKWIPSDGPPCLLPHPAGCFCWVHFLWLKQFSSWEEQLVGSGKSAGALRFCWPKRHEWSQLLLAGSLCSRGSPDERLSPVLPVMDAVPCLMGRKKKRPTVTQKRLGEI